MTYEVEWGYNYEVSISKFSATMKPIQLFNHSVLILILSVILEPLYPSFIIKFHVGIEVDNVIFDVLSFVIVQIIFFSQLQ